MAVSHTTHTLFLAGGLVLTGLWSGPVQAQERPGRPGRGNVRGQQEPEEAVRFNFNNASLETVMRDLSEKLGVTVAVDDDAKAKLKGKKITAVSANPIPRGKAIEFINGVLAPMGVTGVRVKDLVKLMTVERAKTETFTINVGADPEQIDFSDEIVTQIIPLRYATAEDLKKEIGDLVSEDGKLLYNARSNSLVLTDKSTNVRRFVTIVKAIDQQVFGGIRVKSFRLKNADAEEVARIVREVFAPPGGGSGSSNNNSRGRGGFGRMMRMFMGNQNNNNSAKASPLGEVKVSTEPRTNTVVVSAAAEQIDEIAGLVADLDKTKVPDPVTRVFPIRNGDAQNVAQLLNNIFQQSNNARNNRNNNRNNTNNNPFANFFGGRNRNNNNNNRGGGNRNNNNRNNRRRRSDRDMGPAAPAGTFGMPSGMGDEFAAPTMQEAAAPEQPPEPGVEGPVTVQADPDSNSVIVNSDPENMDAIRRLINELDQIRPQVMVKCFIAEVRLSDDSQLGMEWQWNDSLTLGNDPGTGSAGSNFDLTAPANALGFQYQLLSENIDIFIQGLKRAGKLKVLSAPRVLALDNETAEVNVGREVPFIRNSRIDENGNVINTVEYEEIGIILRVTPHVNADGDVRLEVEPEVSEVAPDSESVQISPGVNSPTFLNTSAATTVTVRNNQTVIIGGLIRDRWSKSTSSVPILGDIPLLGELFKTDLFEKERQELMIFLTPVVITKPHDLELLTRQEVLALDLITEAFFERHILHDGVPSEEKRLRVVRKGSADLEE